MRQPKWAAVLPLVAYFNICFFWGTSSVANKLGSSALDPWMVGVVRFWWATALLAVWMLVRRVPFRYTRNDLKVLGIGAFLLYFLNTLLLLLASTRVDASITIVVLCLIPVGMVLVDSLAQRRLQLTLSISLHAPNDEIRDRSMPINRKYNMERLLAACRDYFAVTGRRISFEYALIAGVNDSPACARQLAERLRGMGAHVNLIPVNEVRETGFKRGSRAQIQGFQRQLQQLGVNATIRRELGADISAACGQLRRQTAAEQAPLSRPAGGDL
mgnify:CR=1 FL=1